MKFVKILIWVGLLLAVAAGAGWQFWLKPQQGFAVNATAYTAKQICSCRFVAKREMESCMGDFTANISRVTVTETENEITSKAPYGLATNSARYEPGLGCTLVKS